MLGPCLGKPLAFGKEQASQLSSRARRKLMIKKTLRKELRGPLWGSSCSPAATCSCIHSAGSPVHHSVPPSLSAPFSPSPVHPHLTHQWSCLCAGPWGEGEFVQCKHLLVATVGTWKSCLFSQSLPQLMHSCFCSTRHPFVVCLRLSVPQCLTNSLERSIINNIETRGLKMRLSWKLLHLVFTPPTLPSSPLLCVVRVFVSNLWIVWIPFVLPLDYMDAGVFPNNRTTAEFVLRFYLFIFRDRGREGEREGEKRRSPWPGVKLVTLHRLTLSPLSRTSQGELTSQTCFILGSRPKLHAFRATATSFWAF